MSHYLVLTRVIAVHTRRVTDIYHHYCTVSYSSANDGTQYAWNICKHLRTSAQPIFGKIMFGFLSKNRILIFLKFSVVTCVVIWRNRVLRYFAEHDFDFVQPLSVEQDLPLYYVPCLLYPICLTDLQIADLERWEVIFIPRYTE